MEKDEKAFLLLGIAFLIAVIIWGVLKPPIKLQHKAGETIKVQKGIFTLKCQLTHDKYEKPPGVGGGEYEYRGVVSVKIAQYQLIDVEQKITRYGPKASYLLTLKKGNKYEIHEVNFGRSRYGVGSNVTNFDLIPIGKIIWQ